jgi:hypothetical protein
MSQGLSINTWGGGGGGVCIIPSKFKILEMNLFGAFQLLEVRTKISEKNQITVFGSNK